MGLGLAWEKGAPRLAGDLVFSPSGWWGLGLHESCDLDFDCRIEGRARLSLEVLRTVPRLSIGYGEAGFSLGLGLDRFLSRRWALRGELGWRSGPGVYGLLSVGVFPFD